MLVATCWHAYDLWFFLNCLRYDIYWVVFICTGALFIVDLNCKEESFGLYKAFNVCGEITFAKWVTGRSSLNSEHSSFLRTKRLFWNYSRFYWELISSFDLETCPWAQVPNRPCLIRWNSLSCYGLSISHWKPNILLVQTCRQQLLCRRKRKKCNVNNIQGGNVRVIYFVYVIKYKPVFNIKFYLSAKSMSTASLSSKIICT